MKNKKEYFDQLLIKNFKSKIKYEHNILKATWLDTQLGPVLAIADEKVLYLLEFVERKGLEREIERLKEQATSNIIYGKTQPIFSIEHELNLYFEGTLKIFKTPVCLFGTPFQKHVWQELLKIPHGETRSYADLANAIGKPTAFRAVARANATNQLAILIPCHRVINKNGQLCGYGAGPELKKWLINHEKNA